MPKGQEQIAEAVDLCRKMAAEVEQLGASAEEKASFRAQLEAAAARLETLKGKFFVKMAPSLRYTRACLAAAEEARTALAPGDKASALAEGLAALEAAVRTLEDRANAPGSITIT